MQAKRKQSGFALLLFMIVMIGFITAGFSGLLSSRVKQKNEQARAKTTHALLQAKEALLSYAVDYRVEDKGPGGTPDGKVDFYRMGRLPCPDASDTSFSGDVEGNQDPTCGGKSVNTIGFFPFKTVGLGKIEDANGECLWYAVSGDYKNNIGAEMLNRDSVGYLNVVDENGNLKHGANEDEFPIALIISPGAALGGQDHSADAALPDCKANYTVSNYLEGGANINYATDHPATADTLWKFLDTSESTRLENADHNDQVIAIYRHELWDRVAAMKDLDFDNANGVTPSTEIENLTRSLAECIAAYGNADSKRRLPYPAPVALSDYRVNDNYDDDNSILYGRFPQVVNSSVTTQAKFVLDTSGASYCEGQVSAGLVTDYEELFWKNWKDHFFYIVSKDYNSANNVDKDKKCNHPGAECIAINSATKPVAAVVIYSGKALAGKSRVWWWDAATSSVKLPDDKSDRRNYLEGDDENIYTGGNSTYTMSSITTDYAWCIIQQGSPQYKLSAMKCNDY